MFPMGENEIPFAFQDDDGPSLGFSIIAIFRPPGDKPREKIETEIYFPINTLKNGPNPKNWIVGLRPLITEATELDTKL